MVRITFLSHFPYSEPPTVFKLSCAEFRLVTMATRVSLSIFFNQCITQGHVYQYISMCGQKLLGQMLVSAENLPEWFLNKSVCHISIFVLNIVYIQDNTNVLCWMSISAQMRDCVNKIKQILTDL